MSNTNLTRDLAVKLIKSQKVICPKCNQSCWFQGTLTKTRMWNTNALPAKRSIIRTN